MRRSPSVLAALVAGALLTTLAAGEETVLLPRGSDWKYVDDGSDQGIAWFATAFDDSSWASAPAQLGYGDGDETSTVGFGGDPNNRFVTTYFRRTLTISDPADFVLYRMEILCDDGAVVYLNGQELFRVNMPVGPIGFQTLSATTYSGSEEDLFASEFVSQNLLVPGENVIAVEIHQRSLGSSDISFDLALHGRSGAPCVVRGPYLQLGTPISGVVRWRTDVPTDSVVRFGASPDALDQTVTVAGFRTEHEVELTGLSAETTYFYSAGSTAQTLAGADAQTLLRTPPQAAEVRPVRVWAVGDSGTSDIHARNVRDAYKAFAGADLADVMLMLGDNAYDDGTDAEHQGAIFDVYPEILARTFMWPTLGNHDGRSANSNLGTGVYYDTFTLPTQGEAGGLATNTEAYYSFDFANIHFVCLESYETLRIPVGPMMTWLVADLAATTQDWIIAFWHHPPYSKGSHDSDTDDRMTQMRSWALPILEDAGVDIVLTGHSHSHERSVLIDGHYGTSDTLDTLTMVLDGGDGAIAGDGAYEKPTPGLAPHEGAVYIVAGSSGKISSAPLNHPIMIENNLELGSLLIDVNGLRMDVRFIDDSASVLDEFTIFKGGEPCGAADLAVPFGFLDFTDIVAFVTAFGAGDPLADLAPPLGTLDLSDALVFLGSFGDGCP